VQCVWAIETTFHEVRDHLGVETGRGWSEQTIRRTTPALLGLFSFVTLVAHDYWGNGTPLVKGAAWYHSGHTRFFRHPHPLTTREKSPVRWLITCVSCSATPRDLAKV